MRASRKGGNVIFPAVGLRIRQKELKQVRDQLCMKKEKNLPCKQKCTRCLLDTEEEGSLCGEKEHFLPLLGGPTEAFNPPAKEPP